MTLEELTERTVNAAMGLCHPYAGPNFIELKAHLLEALRQVEADTEKRVREEQCVEWANMEEVGNAAKAYSDRLEKEGFCPLEHYWKGYSGFKEGAQWLRANVKMRTVDDVRAEILRGNEVMNLLLAERAKAYMLLDALEYYSHPDHYEERVTFKGTRQPGVLTDNGQKAREALKIWRGE